MTHKELKKLADTCRKSGISFFKNSEIEFTLSDVRPPVARKPRGKKASQPQVFENEETQQEENISENELLFWSSGGSPENIQENQ